MRRSFFSRYYHFDMPGRVSYAPSLPFRKSPKGKTAANQELWKKLFTDPSQWWDNRFNKDNPKLPDFVHKVTKEALWFDPWHDSPWVELQLSELDENRLVSSSAPEATHLSSTLRGSTSQTNASMVRNSKVYSTFANVKELCDEGQLEEALQAVRIAGQAGYRVSTTIYHRLLQECKAKGSIASTRILYNLIKEGGFETDAFLGNHLIRTFVLFGSLEEAHLVFSKLNKPDVFVWSAIISAHSKLGLSEHAIDLYCQMQKSNVRPDGHVFVAGLGACVSAMNLTLGKLINAQILESGVELDVVVANALIDMYMKCGSLQDGQRSFEKLPLRDVISWSSLIAGYGLHGHTFVAIELFYQMQKEGVEPNVVTWNGVLDCLTQQGCFDAVFSFLLQMKADPDNYTFVSLLKACPTLKVVMKVHAYIIEMGFQYDVIVGNTLIDKYCKFETLPHACKVFKSLICRNMVSWNALIAGYAQNGYVYEADCLFQQMQEEGIELDNAAWNALIAGYAVSGHTDKAFSLFHEMEKLSMKPDKVTFLSILKAWPVFAKVECVNLIYSQILEWGLHLDIMVINTLIDTYSKCGSIDDARRIFDMLSKHSTATWNTMMTGYAQRSLEQEAFNLFTKMQCMGIKPDKFTYISILQACSSVLALDHGMQIHDQVVQSGIQEDVFVRSSLVDMYVKCGSNEDARKLSLQTCSKDTVMWNALIAGHAHNNDYDLALHCYKDMQQGDCRLDDVTFVGLLSACSHSGLVEESFSHFKTMTENNGIAPTFDHYNCLVDTLGRAGFLSQALNLLESVPFADNLAGWTSLLGHCRAHGNAELGEKCQEQLFSCG